MSAEIFLIYARAANGTIGRDGQLPWHIPADLKRFKQLTLGKPIIMGRKTFDSFASLLPGRRHIVLTRNPDWHAAGAEVARSVEEAIALAGSPQIWVIGGAEIYRLFLPFAHRVEVTEIHAEFDGDTFMPKLGSEWEVFAREDHRAQGGQPAFSFVTYHRHDAESVQ